MKMMPVLMYSCLMIAHYNQAKLLEFHLDSVSSFQTDLPDVFPRSSMAAKGLVCELPPIDPGYRGEIHAIISNVSTSSQTIHKDTCVGQLVITPVVIADFVLDLGEERGTGAFGSTGE